MTSTVELRAKGYPVDQPMIVTQIWLDENKQTKIFHSLDHIQYMAWAIANQNKIEQMINFMDSYHFGIKSNWANDGKTTDKRTLYLSAIRFYKDYARRYAKDLGLKYRLQIAKIESK